MPGLFGLFVHGVTLAESAVLHGFHTIGMILLFLGRIVVSLLAFGTCQCDLGTHISYLRVIFTTDLINK